jgi:hypothetical protein
LGQALGLLVSQLPDPFEMVFEQLAGIEKSITDLTNRHIEDRFVDAKKELADCYVAFAYVASLKKSGGKPYEEALLQLTDPASLNSTNLYKAEQRFFGEGLYAFSASPMKALLDWLQTKKFYSRTSQNDFNALLQYFCHHQTQAYLLLASSHLLRAFRAGENQALATEHLAVLSQKMASIAGKIGRWEIPDLPERVNIDHVNHLAWIGACGEISNFLEFMPPDLCWQTHRYYNNIPRTCAEQFLRGSNGSGQKDWAGPIPMVQMMKASAFVALETREWIYAYWRSPTEYQVKSSFIDDAKKHHKNVDVLAFENGFSCYSASAGMELKAFASQPNSPYSDLALVPARYRKAGGGYLQDSVYLDCTLFDFRNLSGKSKNIYKAYLSKNHKNYSFFTRLSAQ